MDLSLIVSEMAKKAAAVAPIGNTLKFNMGGEFIYIDGNNGNAVTAEDKDADCTISVEKDDFIALTTGDLNPMMAFMGGKIKVDGDVGVAMKLQNLL